MKLYYFVFSFVLHVILIGVAIKYKVIANNKNVRSNVMYVNMIKSKEDEGERGADKSKAKSQNIKQVKPSAKSNTKPIDSSKPPISPSSTLISNDHSHQPTTSETVPWTEYYPAPTYPEIAKVRNWQGEVTVVIETDQNGKVHTAKIVKSSGYQALDNAAMEVLASWRSKPSVKLSVPFIFKLNES